MLPAASAVQNLVEDWESWKKQFLPMERYESEEEELKRFKAFLATHARVAKLNALDTGSAVYSHMTKFADLTEEEFKASKLSCLNTDLRDEAEEKAHELAPMHGDTPDSWDWREHGAVNDVQDQGQCGSCWAFGTVANIEGAYQVQTGGELMKLSEQELVDCSRSDMGCNGGLPSRAYGDMIKNHMGLELESAYPYHSGSDGARSKCTADPNLEKMFINDWKSISSDEDQIVQALYAYGPLAIGINAAYLQTYQSGVMNPWWCNPLALDHAVVLVGYGAEGSTKSWTIRNSWAANWGEKGYFRIVRGKGKCGLNRTVTTALFSTNDSMLLV